MKTFDIVRMPAYGYDRREENVFFETAAFKLRVIDLAPGRGMPRCDMMSHVVFVCVEGGTEVIVNGEAASLSAGQGLVTPPASISMQAESRARLLGIQITPAGLTEKDIPGE